MEKLAQRLLVIAGMIALTGAGLLLSVIMTGPAIVLLMLSALLVMASLGVRVLAQLTAGTATRESVRIVRQEPQGRQEGEAPARFGAA